MICWVPGVMVRNWVGARFALAGAEVNPPAATTTSVSPAGRHASGTVTSSCVSLALVTVAVSPPMVTVLFAGVGSNPVP